jgi:predicted aspartyl protease
VRAPFDANQGLIILGAKLWGPTGSVVLRVALDTGATSTIVNVGILVAVGYDPAMAPDRVQVTTGSGVEFAPRVLVSKIAVLGEERDRFLILAHTLPPSAGVDGLLGLDFFRDRHVVVDFRSGQVILS